MVLVQFGVGAPIMKYYCDQRRHLVCVPYSVDNLHRMAVVLDIKRCWFHSNHYDIPKRRINEIQNKCIVVSSKDIVKIVNSLPYSSTGRILASQAEEAGSIPAWGAKLGV